MPIRSAKSAASLATIPAARRPACAAMEGRASIGRATALPAEDVVASRGDRLVVGEERANRALRVRTVLPHSGVRRPRSKPLTELAVGPAACAGRNGLKQPLVGRRGDPSLPDDERDAVRSCAAPRPKQEGRVSGPKINILIGHSPGCPARELPGEHAPTLLYRVDRCREILDQPSQLDHPSIWSRSSRLADAARNRSAPARLPRGNPRSGDIANEPPNWGSRTFIPGLLRGTFGGDRLHPRQRLRRGCGTGGAAPAKARSLRRDRHEGRRRWGSPAGLSSGYRPAVTMLALQPAWPLTTGQQPYDS